MIQLLLRFNNIKKNVIFILIFFVNLSLFSCNYKNDSTTVPQTKNKTTNLKPQRISNIINDNLIDQILKNTKYEKTSRNNKIDNNKLLKNDGKKKQKIKNKKNTEEPSNNLFNTPQTIKLGKENFNNHKQIIDYLNTGYKQITIGNQIFTVKKQIAAGAAGVLFAIEQYGTNKDFILKIEKTQNNEAIKTENEMHKRLISNFGTKDFTINSTILNCKISNNNNTVFLLKQFVKGTTLKRLIEENKLQKIVHALNQYLQLIVEMSKAGIVISDLHVNNIMLDEEKNTNNEKEEKIKVIDGNLEKKYSDNVDFLSTNINFTKEKWIWKQTNNSISTLQRLILENYAPDNIINVTNEGRDILNKYYTNFKLKITSTYKNIYPSTTVGLWHPSSVSDKAKKILTIFDSVLHIINKKNFGSNGEKLPADFFSKIINVNQLDTYAI